jgi:hypothetical protein
MLPLDLKTWYEANASWIGLLSLMLAIVAIPLALWLWRRPHRSKMLGAERISGYSLVQVPENQRGRYPLKLVYGSQDVTAPYITVLRVGSMGDEEVRADDFEIPITIDFPNGQLLAYDVIDKSKPVIEPVFTVDTNHPNRITLKPLLLNGHEWVDIQCVSDGNPGTPKVQSRVAGETKTMVLITDRAERTRLQLRLLSMLSAVPIVIIIGISMLTSDDPFGYQYILPVAAFGVGFILGSLPLLDKTEMRDHRAWAKKQT